MKLERLLAIIFKLLNNEILSASRLADEFQVTTRTIYRDIDAICAAGIPVVSHQGTNGGFGIIEGYKMDKSFMGSNDISILLTVLSSLSRIFEDKNMQHTMDKLSAVDPTGYDKSLLIDLASHRTEPRLLTELRMAILDKKVIRFDYVSSKNEFTAREIEPIHLRYRFRNWYIYSFCRERKDYREFRISRIMNITITQDAYLQNHEINDDELSHSKSDMERFEDVVIWVHPNSLSGALDQFRNYPKVLNRDGSMTFTISVYEPLHARWLKSILLGFGSGVKIIKPVELQAILIEEAKKIVKLYEDV